MAEPRGEKLPGAFQQFCEWFPDLADAHERMTAAAFAAGPLDEKTGLLVKLGVAVGAGLESAAKSHVRRAVRAGATHAEIEQAVMLAMTTVGFPRTVAAWTWVRQQFERDRAEAEGSSTGSPPGTPGGPSRTRDG